KNATAIIELDFLADSFSFDHRRPSQSNTFQIEFKNAGSLVYSADVSTIAAWNEFEYLGTNGLFDEIVMKSTNNFVIDNLQINAVPVPTSMLLLLSGLFPIVWHRTKR
ncbi:MAG: hypothetical protein WC836_24310, partial [Desulfobacula sp.]